MKIRNLARFFAFALSLVLLMGMIPALATEAEPPRDTENLLSELEEANRPAQLFTRHTTEHRHDEIYSQGELFFTADMYVTAESVYYLFGENYLCYITPTRFTDYYTDDGLGETLMPPEENAETLETYQKFIWFLEDTEAIESVEEQDGERVITTRMTDADAIRDYLEGKLSIYGDGIQTDYGEGAEMVLRYRADAADLTMKELAETVCLPDGSELPLAITTFTYDEALPDPAAPDSPLAPALDEAAEKKAVTVVFMPGTPEEETCHYTVAKGVPMYFGYHGKFATAYDDAACTQPTEGEKSEAELTFYVKPDEE